MQTQRATLKHPIGWFAAGREVRAAAELLSDGTFRVFVWLCLNADRHSGRIAIEPADVAKALKKPEQEISGALMELTNSGVCVENAGRVEIADRFWPYIKCKRDESTDREADYVQQLRAAIAEPLCVNLAFTPADEQLAVGLYNRGVRIELVRRAIWLGCARKYVAMLNGERYDHITSLKYFIPVIEEAARLRVPDSYWEHLRRKAKRMEKTWADLRARAIG